jgi:hypothetical protein
VNNVSEVVCETPDLRQDFAFACSNRLNHDISQPVSAPGFELGTFRIGSRMLPSIRPLS